MKGKRADALAARLVTSLAAQTGKLADPTDLPVTDDLLDEDGMPDPAKVEQAVGRLIEAKPHVASTRPQGDIGQGARSEVADLPGLGSLLRSAATYRRHYHGVMRRFLAGAVTGVLATLTLGLVVLPGLGNYVQYRPVWSIRDDYLQGRQVGKVGAQLACEQLSVVVYGHKWIGDTPPGAGPARDQIAFERGCSDVKSYRGNRVDDLEAILTTS